MKIDFFNYKQIYKQNKNVLIKAFISVSKNGKFILQDDLLKFEENLNKFHGCKYSLGVGNATDAMQMLLIASNIGTGDEVIFCSHTMSATASAIKFVGAKPIPIDCNHEYLMDYKKIEEKINSRTKAIFVTQLNGRIADMNEICHISKKHNLLIFEDSAQAIGSKYYGKASGTFGVGGCLSFYPAKVLGCLGDGGAVITNNRKIYNKIKLLRDHGRDKSDTMVWGFNSRLDNLQAAFLNHFLTKIKSNILKRRKMAAIYYKCLSSNTNIKSPPNNLLEKNRFDNYQNFEIQCLNRDKLKLFLFKNKIGSIVPWGGKAVHQFKNLKLPKMNLKYTESIMKQSLLIPMNHFLKEYETKYICKIINKFYEV
jgi:dTDP-4-amino-4,6-dideoxygalactose transaminase